MKQLQNAIGMRLALMVGGGLSLSDLKREEGQTLVEYALIIALIGVVCAVALTFLSGKVNAEFTSIGNKLVP